MTENETVDYTAYATKPGTALHTGFAEWLLEKTEIDLGKKTKEQSFHEGVRLGVVLHGAYQRSEERKAVRKATAVARAQAEMTKTEIKPRNISDEDKATKGGKNPKGSKIGKAAAAKAEPVEAPKPAPRKRSAKPAVAPAVAAASGEEADF